MPAGVVMIDCRNVHTAKWHCVYKSIGSIRTFPNSNMCNGICLLYVGKHCLVVGYCLHVYSYACLHAHVHACMCACMHLWMHACICMYLGMPVGVCVCVCACINHIIAGTQSFSKHGGCCVVYMSSASAYGLPHRCLTTKCTFI